MNEKWMIDTPFETWKWILSRDVKTLNEIEYLIPRIIYYNKIIKNHKEMKWRRKDGILYLLSF